MDGNLIDKRGPNSVRRRAVADLWPSKKDTDRCPLCAVCGVRLLTARGTPRHGLTRYCSDACREHAYVTAGQTDTIRSLLLERDRGTCGGCGRDCGRLEMLLRALGWKGFRLALPFQYGSFPKGTESVAQRLEELARQLGRAFDRRIRELGWGIGHCWEADHIVPVVEGGGGCGLNGYRTLCLECHRAETRALAGRLAARRRGPRLKQLELF